MGRYDPLVTQLNKRDILRIADNQIENRAEMVTHGESVESKRLIFENVAHSRGDRIAMGIGLFGKDRLLLISFVKWSLTQRFSLMYYFYVQKLQRDSLSPYEAWRHQCL